MSDRELDEWLQKAVMLDSRLLCMELRDGRASAAVRQGRIGMLVRNEGEDNTLARSWTEVMDSEKPSRPESPGDQVVQLADQDPPLAPPAGSQQQGQPVALENL